MFILLLLNMINYMKTWENENFKNIILIYLAGDTYTFFCQLCGTLRKPLAETHCESFLFTFYDVPWCYVHPQPTTRQSTRMKPPQNCLSAVTVYYCDTSTLWHSDPKWTDCSSTLKWMVCHSVTFNPTVILANPCVCDILFTSAFDLCLVFCL
jgi:hypothetical protein